MTKKMILGLLVMAAVAGAVSADEPALTGFNAENGISLGNSFGFTLIENPQVGNQRSLLGANPGLRLLADGGSSGFMTGSPFLAGLLNTPLGLWSWLNKDYLGGGITAGLMFGGIGSILLATLPDMGGALFLGFGLIVASPIYGFVRGRNQCKKIQAGSLAEALNDNPLNNISFAVLPDGKGGMTGFLAYSLSY